MTEPAPLPLSPSLSAWLEGWENCIQSVLSQTMGQQVLFEINLEPQASADSDLWFTVVAAGAVRGEMTLCLPSATGIRLAQKFLQEPGPPPETATSEHRDALEELLRQIAGQASTALASTAGGELQLHLASSGPPSWAAATAQNLLTRDEVGATVSIQIQISVALATCLTTNSEQPVPISAASVHSPPNAPEAARYERLRDVMLEVKLRFGARHMLLRDILALSAGVVVELDSNVGSPVDLLLDGRVVARGDVVVVDGKYGLRVTQVVDSAPPA
jgi:flagellar motor switch protein FliN/FliY